MSNSRHDPHPLKDTNDLTVAEYVSILDKQVNERLYLPFTGEDGPEHGWSNITQTWGCVECLHEQVLTIPDEQLGALVPHVDIPVVKMRDGVLVEGEVIELACPECGELECFRPPGINHDHLKYEFRGVTLRGVRTNDEHEIHIDAN